MWVTKLLISSFKKKDLLPKNNPIWPKIGIFVYCWLIWCPVGGLAGGCGARCISQDTYLLYTYQEKAVQCYRNQHWKPVSYHTVGQEGKEGKGGQEEACAPRDLSHHGDLDHNRQRHLLPPVM